MEVDSLLTRLVQATQQGFLAEFDACLASNPSLVLSRDADGVTLLHWAAINNHAHLVHRILHLASQQSGSPRLCDAVGGSVKATPLHWAARNGALAASIALVEVGTPDLEVTDIQGLTALHTAAIFDHHLLVAYLVAKGADVDARDQETGRTPLLWACCSQKKEGKDPVVGTLLKLGANVNLKDKVGKTALHWALQAVCPPHTPHASWLPPAPCISPLSLLACPAIGFAVFVGEVGLVCGVAADPWNRFHVAG